MLQAHGLWEASGPSTQASHDDYVEHSWPETARNLSSPHDPIPAAPFTCSVAWVDEVVHGDANHPSINGMQGVRGGSDPLSSTPGQRLSSASTAPDSPTSGSRWAAICVARPIRSSDAAGCCRCRRPGSPACRRPAARSFLMASQPVVAALCVPVWPGPKISYRQRARIRPRPAAPVPPSWQASVATCSSP